MSLFKSSTEEKMDEVLEEPCPGTPDQGAHEWRPYKKKWMVCTLCEQKRDATGKDIKRNQTLAAKKKGDKVNLDHY
eukprot:gene5322-9132_t